MPRKNKQPRWAWPLLSLMATTLLAFPLSYLAIPHFARWHMLRKITSLDLSERELGLNYLIQRAPTDPQLVDGAIEKLNQADGTLFIQIASALEQAHLWQRPPIPDDVWVRWLDMIRTDPSENTRILAAQNFADVPDLADDPRVLQAIDTMLRDQAPNVRYNALVTTAMLSRHSHSPGNYAPLLAHASADENPTIAKHAWIMIGLLGWHLPPPPDWRNQTPEISEAFIWAITRLNPSNPDLAIQACIDSTLPESTRDMAIYALSMSDADAAIAALKKAAPPPFDGPHPSVTARGTWRAILALPPSAFEPSSDSQWALPEDALLFHKIETSAPPQPDFIHAFIYRTIRVTANRALILSATPHDPLRYLAALEGLTPGEITIPINEDVSDLIRFTTIAMTANPQENDLRPLFSSPVSIVRDLACTLAVDRFNNDQNSALAESLLRDYNDDAKRSGAVLAGLTNTQQRFLAKKMADEDVWDVKQIHRLGLWMQGNHPELEGVPEALLTRDDLPTSTILLAMLHRHHPAAMEFLFNPTGEENLDLDELLCLNRWWLILKRYLPADAPPLWLWADPELRRFQIDVIRDWHLLNRDSLRAQRH
jgi:hypothetical protein